MQPGADASPGFSRRASTVCPALDRSITPCVTGSPVACRAKMSVANHGGVPRPGTIRTGRRPPFPSSSFRAHPSGPPLPGAGPQNPLVLQRPGVGWAWDRGVQSLHWKRAARPPVQGLQGKGPRVEADQRSPREGTTDRWAHGRLLRVQSAGVARRSEVGVAHLSRSLQIVASKSVPGVGRGSLDHRVYPCL